jgi:hypothetical protein
VKLTSIARLAGLLVGLSLALVSLVNARVPAGTGEVPAHLSLVAESSVKLGIAPVGRELLSERLVVPGRNSVSGLVEVSNFTTGAVELSPRLRATHGELPEGLRVEVTAGRKTLYDGEASSLDAELRLRRGAAQGLRFRFSAPAGAASTVEGRHVDLVVRWSTRKAGR